jgi:hypothetical protein
MEERRKPSLSLVGGLPTLDQLCDIYRNPTGKEPTKEEKQEATVL